MRMIQTAITAQMAERSKALQKENAALERTKSEREQHFRFPGAATSACLGDTWGKATAFPRLTQGRTRPGHSLAQPMLDGARACKLQTIGGVAGRDATPSKRRLSKLGGTTA